MGDYGEQPTKRKVGPGGKAHSGPAGRPTRFSLTAGRIWGDVDPAKLQSAIRHISDSGGGLLLSATRDGTASTCTLFYNEQRVRFYPASVETAELLLDALVEWGMDPERDIDYWYRGQ